MSQECGKQMTNEKCPLYFEPGQESETMSATLHLVKIAMKGNDLLLIYVMYAHLRMVNIASIAFTAINS